jgi:hypothetical protein
MDEKVIHNANLVKIIHKADIVEYQNVLTESECKYLLNYWNSLDDWIPSCFYGMYIISGKKEISIEAGMKLRNVQLKLWDLAETVFQKDLRQISLSPHRWLPGAFAADHADNAELDGTPNAWKENKLVSILYLNDNYEGGKLTFRDHEIAIKPKMGSVVVFDVGIDNVHAVTEVISGERYTMLGSYDFTDSVYDEDLDKIKDSVKETQYKQRSEWLEGKIMPKTTATDPTKIK